MAYAPLDTKDLEILATRQALLDSKEGTRVGDFVRFSDGDMQRISYRWDDQAQTSHGGSWHLGNGFVSHSGSLNPGVSYDLLTLTDETQEGRVWIEHHGFLSAGCRVETTIAFRVYEASVASDHWHRAGDFTTAVKVH